MNLIIYSYLILKIIFWLVLNSNILQNFDMNLQNVRRLQIESVS